jgi:hypothetical protein
MPASKAIAPRSPATVSIQDELRQLGDKLYDLVDEAELAAATSGDLDDAVLAARVRAASALVNDHKPRTNQRLDIATLDGISAGVSDGAVNDDQAVALSNLSWWASGKVREARGF